YAASLINQRIYSLQILPFTGRKKESPVTFREEMILESSSGDIAGYLIYLLLGQKFYEIFGLSRLAEMAARFVHLEDSEHKLEDMQKDLKLQYFKQRHELIDRNMRELFAARLTFK
ncbi:F0F1 ATP synthase subunit gamma, partial [Candidatus Omnitrophota bacterium]